MSMTKTERTELGRLIRQRERVMKTAAAQRAAELRADFERQLAGEYQFDDDEVWKAATIDAQRHRIERKDEVVKRLGQSPDRADAVVMAWYRGSIGDWQRRMWGHTGPGGRPLPKLIRGHMNKRRQR